MLVSSVVVLGPVVVAAFTIFVVVAAFAVIVVVVVSRCVIITPESPIVVRAAFGSYFSFSRFFLFLVFLVFFAGSLNAIIRVPGTSFQVFNLSFSLAFLSFRMRLTIFTRVCPSVVPLISTFKSPSIRP